MYPGKAFRDVRDVARIVQTDASGGDFSVNKGDRFQEDEC